MTGREFAQAIAAALSHRRKLDEKVLAALDAWQDALTTDWAEDDWPLVKAAMLATLDQLIAEARDG